jgi:hypothetical protein
MMGVLLNKEGMLVGEIVLKIDLIRLKTAFQILKSSAFLITRSKSGRYC